MSKVRFLIAMVLCVALALCSCSSKTSQTYNSDTSYDDIDDGTDGKSNGYEDDDFMPSDIISQDTASSGTTNSSEVIQSSDETDAEPSETAAGTQKPKTSSKPKASASPKASAKPKTSASPKASAKPKASASPKASATPKAASTPKSTAAAKPTSTPTATPKATATPAPTTAQDAENVVNITLNGTKGSADGAGVSISSDTVAITSPGTYRLKGSYTGQLTVSVDKSDRVYLIFAGLDIKCASSSAVWIMSADKTVITLEDGTKNTLTDASKYLNVNVMGEPNACLFSKDDLTIKGTGSLSVVGNFGNGVMTKDDLKITGGNITVNAAKNGLRGNDSVSIAGGTIDITAKKDGIKTTNENDTDKGFLLIEGGNIVLKCTDDGLQATRSVTVKTCKIKMQVKGDKVNCQGQVSIADGCIS